MMISTKHRYFIVPGRSISLICIVVKIRYSWTKHKFNLHCCENKIFKIGKGKTSGLLNYLWKDCLGQLFPAEIISRNSFSVAGCIYCKLGNLQSA